MDIKIIAKNLKRIREERGLTQQQLHQKTGVSNVYISNLEKGIKKNPSFEMLAKLAQGLECSVEELTSTKKNTDEEIFPEKFEDAGQARIFLRKHQYSLKASSFDASKLTDEEILKFANDVLEMIKLLSYKYKK